MKFSRRAATVLAVSILCGWIAAAAGTAQDKPVEQTLTGTIGDLMCARKHTMFKNLSDQECTLKCIKLGSKFCLIANDQVYKLTGKTADLDKLAGAKVKVTGTVNGKEIDVHSIGKS